MSHRSIFRLAIVAFFACTILGSGTAIGDEPVSAPENPPAEAPGGPAVPEIDSLIEASAVIASSAKQPVFIYKHSTTCPINARAAARIDAFLKDAPKDTPKMVFVKVIESRSVSNAIAKTLDVKHESPQLILVKDGKAVWNTSHEDITAASMAKAIEDVGSVEATPAPETDASPGASQPE